MCAACVLRKKKNSENNLTLKSAHTIYDGTHTRILYIMKKKIRCVVAVSTLLQKMPQHEYQIENILCT